MSVASSLRGFARVSVIAAAALLLQCCIKNDIPYPRIPQMILAIAAEGQSRDAYIDSIAFEVNVYLEETTDIENVRFSEYVISPDGTSDPNLLDGTYNLSEPLFVTLSRYQDYTWQINAIQDIERYFEVSGELGASVVDPVGHRVIVNMPEGTDLADLELLKVKLGPTGMTTMVPDLVPGPLDLSYPLRVEVTAYGRTEIWTIYAQFSESIVNTTQVDAWSKVIWAYGTGPSDVTNGFEYRKVGDTEWTPVPAELVTQTQGVFSCYIPHLEPLTEYAVRTVSGTDYGNEMRVTTEATADIPDGDFEQWSKGGRSGNMWQPWDEGGEPFWDSGNKGSIMAGINLTTPSDHTATGSGKAACCKTVNITVFGISRLGAGSIFTGTYVRTDIPNGVLGFGRPWNLRPTKLKGFYQYTAADIAFAQAEFESLKGRPDSCQIYVALTDWTAPYEIRTNPSNRQLFNPDADYVIAYGQLTFSGNQTSYQPFEIELKYRDTSTVPTYLQITCSASKYGDYFTGGDGSTLYVDQFSFDWDY